MKKHGDIKAFTLIEMLAAMAIASLLGASALKVAVGRTRCQRSMETADRGRCLRERLEKLLAMDLANAEKLRSVSGGIELASHARVDPANLRISHSNCTVSYMVRKAGDDPCLLRIQRDADGQMHSELIAVGISAIAVPHAGSSSPASAWKEVGQRISINVTAAGASGESKAFVLAFRLR